MFIPSTFQAPITAHCVLDQGFMKVEAEQVQTFTLVGPKQLEETKPYMTDTLVDAEKSPSTDIHANDSGIDLQV